MNVHDLLLVPFGLFVGGALGHALASVIGLITDRRRAKRADGLSTAARIDRMQADLDEAVADVAPSTHSGAGPYRTVPVLAPHERCPRCRRAEQICKDGGWLWSCRVGYVTCGDGSCCSDEDHRHADCMLCGALWLERPVDAEEVA